MPVNTTLEKYKNAALFLRHTLIRQEKGLFKDALQTEEIRKRRLCVLVWTERSSLQKAPGEDGKIVQWAQRAEEHESKEFGERSDRGGAGGGL